MDSSYEFPDGEFIEQDLTCKWLDTEGCELCQHPEGKMFCDYTWNAEFKECDLYEPVYESSKVEEEVRQYLEYTRESKEKEG